MSDTLFEVEFSDRKVIDGLEDMEKQLRDTGKAGAAAGKEMSAAFAQAEKQADPLNTAIGDAKTAVTEQS